MELEKNGSEGGRGRIRQGLWRNSFNLERNMEQKAIMISFVASNQPKNRCEAILSVFFRHRHRIMQSRPLRLIHKSDFTFIHVPDTTYLFPRVRLTNLDFRHCARGIIRGCQLHTLFYCMHMYKNSNS